MTFTVKYLVPYKYLVRENKMSRMIAGVRVASSVETDAQLL